MRGLAPCLKGEASDASDKDMPDSAFDVLQALRTGETGRYDAVTVNEKKTTPPPLFTEATLLAALVRVADFIEDAQIKQLLKEKAKDKKDEHGGIGTPTTRSDMLEKLKDRQFIREEKGKLFPLKPALPFSALCRIQRHCPI